MMRPSLRSYSTRRRILFRSPAAFVTAGLAFVILILFVLRFAAPGAFVAIATPFWQGGAAFTHFLEGFQSKASVMRERDQLATQVDTLTAENRTLTGQAHDLQVLLGTRTQAAPGILASVLVRPPVAPYDVLIVDQGASMHVALGATAYGPGGTPIGTVASVTNKTARITLYSNPGLQTDAWVGDARVPIELIGAGSGSFTATLPKTAAVAANQGVYVASAGAVPVGFVARVSSDPSSPNVTLQIHPYLNPFSLTWVTISL